MTASDPVQFQAKLAAITAETSTAETGDYRLDAASAAVDAVIEQANERAASRPSKTIDWAGDIYVKTLTGKSITALQMCKREGKSRLTLRTITL